MMVFALLCWVSLLFILLWLFHSNSQITTGLLIDHQILLSNRAGLSDILYLRHLIGTIVCITPFLPETGRERVLMGASIRLLTFRQTITLVIIICSVYDMGWVTVKLLRMHRDCPWRRNCFLNMKLPTLTIFFFIFFSLMIWYSLQILRGYVVDGSG